MISDSDDKVRYEVVDFLLTLNDPACLQPLINQLATEKNPEVARKIAQILGSLKDAASAPAVARALTPMLHGPNQENQISAAKALASLGENLRQNDPKLADDLSDQLRTILKNIDNQPGAESMRAASIAALAALRDPKSMDTFLNCFKPGETTEVRKAALAGLGNLGDTRANATVIQQLGDADPTVRLEAAPGIGTRCHTRSGRANFGQMKTDRNQEVRDALWIAVKNLYDKEQPDQIKHWASELKNDPEREIVTLEKLSDVLKRGNDARSIASNEEDIAAALTAVKPVTPARAGEAIGHLQQALDYWRGPGKGAGGSR